MKISYQWAMPNKETFKIKPILDFIYQYYENDKLWIDPFANNSQLARITNDLNPNFKTKYNLDAIEFLKLFEDNSVDGCFFDPPYSQRQAKEVYENFGLDNLAKSSAWFWNLKREISRIIKPGGIVLTFGWNTSGISKKYGFKKVELLIVNHGSEHRDTLCLAESKGNYIKAKKKLEKLLT